MLDKLFEESSLAILRLRSSFASSGSTMGSVAVVAGCDRPLVLGESAVLCDTVEVEVRGAFELEGLVTVVAVELKLLAEAESKTGGTLNPGNPCCLTTVTYCVI